MHACLRVCWFRCGGHTGHQAFAKSKKAAKIVMYLTWGYHDGTIGSCPTSGSSKCFPLGTLANLTSPDCTTSSHYRDLAGSFPCMGYGIARGYLAARTYGADMVAPCGMAWQVVRGVQAIPDGCKGLWDGQFTAPAPVALPLKVRASLL